MFFYIKSLFFEEKKILKEHKAILIIPVLFLCVFIIPCSILDSIYNLLILFNCYDNLQDIYDVILFYRKTLSLSRMFSNVVAIIYLIICLSYFFKLKKIMKSSYSYIAQNNFVWMRFLLVFPLIIVCVDAFFVVLEHLFFLGRWQHTEIFTSCILVVSILGLGYYGLNQTKIFVPYFLLENTNEKTGNTLLIKKTKTQPSIEFESLEQKLKSTFETGQLFLNPDLTLGKLAKAIGSTDKKISALLNQHLQISFYEFVNGYRIEAFKQVLKNNQYKDYTIEAISYECGFKSKASFYRVFKSKMKMSPSEYKKSIL